MIELFNDIKRYNDSIKKPKPVEKLEFRTCSYDYIDNVIHMLNTVNDDNYILDAMNSNTDVLKGIFGSNNNSDLLWYNIRFIDLIIKLFKSEKYMYTQLKLLLINNIDKLSTRFYNLLEASEDIDFKLKICDIISILYQNIILQIKGIEDINWDAIGDEAWYSLICKIYANEEEQVAVLNNFMIHSHIGDDKKLIIELYYIFFGKNFSKVAVENIYPIGYDDISVFSLYNHTNITHMTYENKILYKKSENLLKATREIIVSLTTPDIVKILRIIDSNARLMKNTKPTINIFLDENERIQNAIKVMHEYD
jgi:hypothetical protein